MNRPEAAASSGHVVERVLGRLEGPRSGGSLLFVAGLHGNEPAGVVALQRVFANLGLRQTRLRGRVLALAGNRRALALGQRYVDTDLNRHWTAEVIGGVSALRRPQHEDAELAALQAEIHPFLEGASGPVHVVDLHTTSNIGAPFATVGDTIRNRSFAAHFHSSVVLGLEEELQGTLLEYLSGSDCITMGYEAGQHDDPVSVQTHEAVAWVALAAAGILSAEDVPELPQQRSLLQARCRRCPSFFEIRYRHAIDEQDAFRMQPGFTNFDPVRRGQVLGKDRNGDVRSPRDGLILMPLYQGLGSDGFFVGNAVRPFWLRLSAWVRHLHLERVMHWLPGVHRVPDDANVLRVDTRVARWYPLQIFHLLGFRRRRTVGRNLYVSRRRHDS